MTKNKRKIVGYGRPSYYGQGRLFLVQGGDLGGVDRPRRAYYTRGAARRFADAYAETCRDVRPLEVVGVDAHAVYEGSA